MELNILPLLIIVNIPWDVAKSRIQGERAIDESQRKYKSCNQAMLLVYKEEGYSLNSYNFYTYLKFSRVQCTVKSIILKKMNS